MKIGFVIRVLCLTFLASSFQTLSSDLQLSNYLHNKLFLQHKSSSLFNWSSAFKSLVLKNHDSPSKMSSSTSATENSKLASRSARHDDNLKSTNSNLNHMVRVLNNMIFQNTLPTDDESSKIAHPSLEKLSLAPDTVIPNVAVCLQIASLARGPARALVFDRVADSVLVRAGECQIQDLWIPRAVKKNKRIFQLVSAQNGMALAESDGNRIGLEKKADSDNQYWVFVKDTNALFRIYNLKSRNLVAHDFTGGVVAVEQGKSKGFEKNFVLNQQTCK